MNEKPVLQSQDTIANFGALSKPLKITYVITLVLVVTGIATIQGWLTYQNESDLIDLQIGQTCNAVFDAVERGWTEVKLFTETISAGFYSSGMIISQERFTRLGESETVQNIMAMQNFEFVHHLKNQAARLAWEADMINEFTTNPVAFDLINNSIYHGPVSHILGNFYPNGTIAEDFYMFTFDPDDGFGRLDVGTTNRGDGTDTFDPIIYMCYWDPFLWGFFPDPEPPRVDALNLAISTGKTACTNRINLFGHEENPAGLICAMPLWMDAQGDPVPNKPVGATADDVYGFVVPVFKVSLLLDNILGAASFGTDIDDVVIYAFDVGVDAEANFLTGNNGDNYMGKYPTPTNDEFDEINLKTSSEVVTGFAKVNSKKIVVGERDWKIFCGIQDEYISKKRSNLPYLIAALSIGITLIFNVFRVVLNICMQKAQAITRQNSKAALVPPIIRP